MAVGSVLKFGFLYGAITVFTRPSDEAPEAVTLTGLYRQPFTAIAGGIIALTSSGRRESFEYTEQLE